MNTFWKVVQTTVTFGVVGYAAYLWYDIWREEQREAQLQEEEEAEAAAAQAAEKEKAQASSSQLADGNQSKKSSENTTKGSTKNTGKQNSRGFCGRTSTSFVMTDACMDQSFQDFLSFVYPANMPRGTKYAPSMRLVSILCPIGAQIAAGPIAFCGPPLKSLIHLLFNIAM
eukprot:gene9453-17176_t